MNTEQLRTELLPCPFCGETEGLIIQHCEGTIIYPALRIYCDNCGASSGYSDRVDPVANWNRRAALQSQDREDAAHAEWIVDDGRAPWAVNSLKARIKEMRVSEKRCRNAFRKDYMRVVSVYFADALGEAAEALEKRLSAIDRARRIEGDGE